MYLTIQMLCFNFGNHLAVDYVRHICLDRGNNHVFVDIDVRRGSNWRDGKGGEIQALVARHKRGNSMQTLLKAALAAYAEIID